MKREGDWQSISTKVVYGAVFVILVFGALVALQGFEKPLGAPPAPPASYKEACAQQFTVGSSGYTTCINKWQVSSASKPIKPIKESEEEYKEVEYYKEACTSVKDKDGCYYDFAIRTNEVRLCKMAGIYEKRCYSKIAANTCGSMGWPSNVKCYYWTALNTNNEEICDKSGSNVYDCYLEIALNTNNEKLCAKTEDPSWCYYRLAVNTKDEKLCAKAATTDQDLCYQKVGIRKKDVSVCNFLPVERRLFGLLKSYREICIKEVNRASLAQK